MGSNQGHWFALVDTAQDRSLNALVEASTQSKCLISGTLQADLAAALPYIVRIDSSESLIEQWKTRGIGRSWGILFESDFDIEYLRIHFKKFLNVRLPDGAVSIFRFYDPRIFVTYMRSSDPADIEIWFRGILRYFVEVDSSGKMHEFKFSAGELHEVEI